MRALIVVENPKHWPDAFEGAEVVPAEAYLSDRRFHDLRRAAVFNVCRSYAYETVGYYVSLLAAARGHRTLPSVDTLQGLGLPPLIRQAGHDLEERIRRDLAHIVPDRFDLSIYFGRNVAKRYDRLSRALFGLFPAPLLRARFVREDDWRLESVRPIPAAEVPEAHREFVVARAAEYFRRPTRARPSRVYRYDLAILWRPDDTFAPSDEAAIKRFIRAAEAQDIACEIIGPADAGRIAEFDALWIRETTRVDHHTYRLARRAAAEGLVVMDDPDAIVRSGNKVFQAELFDRHRVPCPPTLIVGSGGIDEVEARIGYPCVVKKPDSAFSIGVTRVGDRAGLEAALDACLSESELAVVQAWTPSEFDWRVGVLDREPLFAARYHMARGHWQIARHEEGKSARYGRVEAVPLTGAPEDVIRVGVTAASLFGAGLFGVDLKVSSGRALVMEVNDNPNLEAGYEDAAEGAAIYERLARWYATRLDARGQGLRPGRNGG